MSQMPLFQTKNERSSTKVEDNAKLFKIDVDRGKKPDESSYTVIHSAMLRCSTDDCKFKNPDNTCSCPSALNIKNGQCDVYLEYGKK